MTKDDRYGSAGDTYGSSGDSYEESPSTGRNGGDATPVHEIDDAESATQSDGSGVADLPFIFARRTVKADRDALPVYVRETTAAELDELEREIDERFGGDDVMSLDVREAVVRAGLRNVDDVVDVMEAWGYGRR
ncbi:hypothetical protein SAMN04487948_10547 [Halogranum amylolyticum]|uniref:Uncharacterized protein n=1 Tax=Halogranum amylolyticum TaxID=660520 RepID=A0A1H8SFH9_9EURY|nr:hypothetical protein [Halogranum amylolyticum]SEO77335.1 hypothetical protein SAMN04487948_10547 [Halogranum amylolyticum]